jgi:formylglycine-generating enzyme required for sulfatase activity
MTGKIFLNYRRADAEAWADRLFERLIRQFPHENVFMDIDGNIPVGFAWADWLDKQVAACDLMLVLIGRTWVGEFKAKTEPGERDFVRVEIESALKRKIPVVPVFLGDAPVPRSPDLPESVRPLLALQAARLQRQSFDSDAEALVKGAARSIALARGGVVDLVKGPTQRPEPTPPGAIVIDVSPNGRSKTRAFVPGNGSTEWFTDHPQGPEMVLVPPGSFMMGSPENEPERESLGKSPESPQHKVAITRPFAVGRHAITRGQFAAFVNNTGHKTDGGAYVWKGGKAEHDPHASWRNPGFAQDDSHPVVCVNWQDADAYAAWLSDQTRKTYRLLTEAEREYVARGGTTTAFWWGSSITPAQANYDGNYTYAGGGSKGKATVPVDSFAANPWGLFNVHGNVWEWCADVWHENYKGAPTDGSAWLQGGDASRRVLRGGSWYLNWWSLRAADRIGYAAVDRNNNYGFRLARTLDL